MRELTDDEVELALRLQSEGQSYAKTAESLGFKHIRDFFEYRKTHPEFATALDAARNDSNVYLEDKLLTVTQDIDDPKMARVQLEAISRALAFRDPKRYGQRVELNVTHLDIGGSLSRMQGALDAAYRDVTPALEPKKPNDPNDLW